MGALGFLFASTRVLWVVLRPRTAAYWEESYRYVAAIELASQPVHSFMDYQADHYQGGSLVFIGILGMLFEVLPPSVLLLKLAAVSVSAAICVLVYAVCAKLFDRTVAGISALAYVAGPALLAYWGTVPMGSHAESIGFSFAQIGLLGGLLTGDWRRPAGWLAFGLTAGIGVWFCYTTGMTTLACGVAWVLLRGMPKATELAAAASGFAAGLAPWLAYNVAHDFDGLGRITEIFGGGDPIDHWASVGPAAKLVQLLSGDLPEGWLAPLGNDASPEVRRVLGLAYLVPLGLGLVFAVARTLRPVGFGDREQGGRGATWHGKEAARRRLSGSEHEVAFVVYGAVFLAVFLASRFTIDPNAPDVKYRILLPIAALLVPPAARSASLWIRAGGMRSTAALVGVCLALLASSSSTFLLATREVSGRAPDPIVEGATVRGLLIHRKYETRPDAALGLLRSIPGERARLQAFSGVGWGIEFRYEADGDVQRLFQWLSRVTPDERRWIVSGIRFWGAARAAQVKKILREGQGTLIEERSASRLASLLDLLKLEPLSRTRDGAPR